MKEFHKKESPFQGITGFAGGATGLRMSSSAAVKTYIDDVFSTFLYEGNDTQDTPITNSIDLSGKGGMVWLKGRSVARAHLLYDTVRGASKPIIPSDASAEWTNTSLGVVQFNDDGFNLGSHDSANWSGNTFSSWSFRKQKGFLDIVSYTGNGSNRNISHSLGCQPGCIIIKNLSSGSENWNVYHSSLFDINGSNHYYLTLNENYENYYGATRWNNTSPTTTQFTVGAADSVNKNGDEFIAYVFAGGSDRTTATSCSVQFDGSNDYLSIADDSEFALGSDDFTFEAWIKLEGLNTNGAGWLTDWNLGQLGWYFGTATANSVANRFIFGWSDTGSNINTIDSGYTVKADGQFHHYAITRSGTNLYFFVDGTLIYTHTGVTESFYNPSGDIAVGQNPDVGGSSWLVNGRISNLRLIKGTCLYTTSFRPPTEPLTNVTNTILLCCNSSTVTGSTVTPSTITAVGSPSASIITPFLDPGSFKFGENQDQSIIKCNEYKGNGNGGPGVSGGPVVELGWAPQYVLIKKSSAGENWMLLDTMRGLPFELGAAYLNTNDADAENTSGSAMLNVSATGFQVVSTDGALNDSGANYVYMAIRASDGYVGKPPSAGTGAFTMDMGTGSGTSTIPDFDTTFPIAFALSRNPTSTGDWYTSARQMATKYMLTQTSDAQADGSWAVFDSNLGWGTGFGSSMQSWMWKRGPGLDVVSWEGNAETTRFIPHSLGSVPEMIWIKSRTDAVGWFVGHKALNGGTDPFGNGYYIMFDTGAETNNTIIWNATPTSTHFNVGNYSGVNGTSKDMIAMLFASANDAEGNPISKVGSYSASSSTVTVTTGFQPRFVIAKRISAGGNWITVDSVRGGDKELDLNRDNPEMTVDTLTFTSTGFTLPGSDTSNANITGGGTYLYYAHA